MEHNIPDITEDDFYRKALKEYNERNIKLNPRLSDFTKTEQKLLVEAASAVVPDGGPLDDDWPECQNKVFSAIVDVMPDLADVETHDLENDLIDAIVRGTHD